MSTFREKILDYLWPPVPIPHVDESSSLSHQHLVMDAAQQLQTPPSAKLHVHKHDRKRTTEEITSLRASENIELQPVRSHRRRDDDSPPVGFLQRIRDLESSNTEQRKLAEDRQQRVRKLEKENIDLKAQTEAAMKRLYAIQSANNTFVETISKLERELHTLKFQHSPCADRIVSAETRYSAVLSVHNVLQSTYNDLRSSHQALQDSCTALQMSHSGLLFSHSAPFLRPPPPPTPPERQPHLQIETSVMSRESSVQTSSDPISSISSEEGSDVSRLKILLSDRTSQLTSLQTFLSKHDEWSGAQVLQAVKDLNGEIARLAAAMSEHYVFVVGSVGAGPSSPIRTEKPTPDNGELQTLLREALGSKLYGLLISRAGPSSDPSLMMQYALQTWQVWCCSQIFDRFCFGLPDEVERWISDIWENMKLQELQPMSSRWRGLAHEYLRTSLQLPVPRTTQLPTPPASPCLSAINNPRSLLSKQELNLLHLNFKGMRGILELVGICTNSVMKLEEEFGDSVTRIQEQAMNLARVIREGVMSGWFEIVRIPGLVSTPVPESTSVPGNNRSGKGKGKAQKGKYAEVMPVAPCYDEESMENVFRGYGREEGGVMCTVEFGLVCVRKDDTENGVEQDLDEKKQADGRCQVFDRRMLMKPKVLLESVEEIL